MSVHDEIIEDESVSILKSLVKLLARIARPLWRWGDGEGGYVYQELHNAFKEAGLEGNLQGYSAASTGKAKQVFERDRYRCCQCGGWRDLEIDHIYPKGKGGSSELDNLQTLCGNCNRVKGARLP